MYNMGTKNPRNTRTNIETIRLVSSLSVNFFLLVRIHQHSIPNIILTTEKINTIVAIITYV